MEAPLSFVASLVLLLGSFLGSTALAAGFSIGNTFSAVSISGALSLECPSDEGESVSAVFNCRDSILSPAMYDYFLGPQGVDADSVELIVTRADRSVHNKVIKYDARSAKSREKFNLWETGLFSKALLADGNNQIVYKLSKAGQMQTQGEFSVVVVRKASMTCDSENRISKSPTDCQSQLTMCGKYFESQNFCQ